MKTALMDTDNSNNQKLFPKMRLLSAMLFAMQLAACATTVPGQQHLSKHDPYENSNRQVYKFNDYLDVHIASPVAKAYRWVTPDILQTGIYNFFYNLKEAGVVMNDLLQAKFKQGAEDAGRFVVNSTIGLGGLVDVAKDAGLPRHDEDFEQTLATWGVPPGPYLVVPFMGPMTSRGVPGVILDTAANPSTYTPAPIRVVEFLHRRAISEPLIKSINESLDPYVFTREAYLQNLNYLISDGKDKDTFDIDSELGNVISEPVKQTNTVSSKSNYPLKQAVVETNQLDKALPSFNTVAKTFENTTVVFQDTNFKLHRQKQKTQQIN